MDRMILSDASFAVLRTNPKLTTNIKLMVDSNDNLYLESFSANEELSKKTFKGIKIDPSSDYSRDLNAFYGNGAFPKNLAYEVFKRNKDTVVLDNYRNQYEDFYWAGAEPIVSNLYDESIGIFAPIWLNKQIPKYFVVVRVNGPVASDIKNIDSESFNVNIDEYKSNFINDILKDAHIVKTFDLTKNSNIGKYLHNIVKRNKFIDNPLSFTTKKNTSTTWNGISYNSGGYTSKGEFIYDSYINHDNTIIEDDYFITKGFERNGIVSGNLVNLEFMFDDVEAEDFTINRYFGLYVDDINEGCFELDGNAYYEMYGVERTQGPKPFFNNEINTNKPKDFYINNENGVLLYVNSDSINTVTALPTSKYVSDQPSFFYTKDTKNKFHKLSHYSTWNTRNDENLNEIQKLNLQEELRITDKRVNLNDFMGFDNISGYSKSEILESAGNSHMVFTINGRPLHGYSVDFYDGDKFIATITASEDIDPSLNKNKAYYTFFNTRGTTTEIANSFADAVNNIISDTRIISAGTVGNQVVIISTKSGDASNDIRFELDKGVKETNVKHYYSPEFEGNFIGGSNKNDSRLKVKADDVEIFEIGKYVKTENGYGKIISSSYYVDDAERNVDNSINTFNDFDEYKVITIENSVPKLNSSLYATIYDKKYIDFGRFSIYPIKDFDFDTLSLEYNDLGELEVEAKYYQDEAKLPNKMTHPDIRSFYENGFTQIQPMLTSNIDEVIEDSIDGNINEYDRLKENYILELSTISKTVPYINKWTYVNGKDIRNNDYRLNMTEAFGTYNFTPSMDVTKPDPLSFTHEWYLLSKTPDYFQYNGDINDFSKTWSYFNDSDSRVFDNTKDNETLGFFQDINTDNFTDYFVVDRLKHYNGETFEWVPIDKQIRYSTFLNGSDQKSAESFFRGIKVSINKRSENTTKLNYNLNRINYINDDSYNSYKFAAILIPHHNKSEGQVTKPIFEIKFVENHKWKTVTMMIFLDMNYEEFDNNSSFIDRTMLYALKNNIQAENNTFDTITDGVLNYRDVKMRGAIDFIHSKNQIARSSTGPYIIKGMDDINGVFTDFKQDIKLNTGGNYNNIKFTVDPDSNIETDNSVDVSITGITKVIDSNTLLANSVSIDGNYNIKFPITSIVPKMLRESSYLVEKGGYQVYDRRLRNISFANIMSLINQGDPSIIYETVDKEGNISYDNFTITLVGPDRLLKPSYLNVIPDSNKPVKLNLSDTIGYKLILAETARLIPFFRHSGSYMPKFNDVCKFTDPHLLKSTLSEYESKVFDLMRHKNTIFDIDNDEFGIIKNLYYHKVNPDNTNILELTDDTAFKSVYPLIDETGIDNKDYYVFKSNWETGYYTKHITKSEPIDIVGTKNFTEHKALLNSKLCKIPNSIDLEQFTIDEDVFIDETTNEIIFDVDVVKKLSTEIGDKLLKTFQSNINPAYGFGTDDSLIDDTKEYIKKNILPRYKIEEIRLFVSTSKPVTQTSYIQMSYNEQEMLATGMRPVQNFSTLFSNDYNFELTFNKQTGYNYAIGLSVVLSKR